MVRVLVVLKVEGAFDVVAERTPGAAVDGRPSDLTVGLESTFDQVWSCLVEEEQVGIIGLYGMEGWVKLLYQPKSIINLLMCGMILML